jgi:UDP-2,4-diacetamido-2,4,6-trideoxy-beta-L-altropyranose hydrolase
MSKAITIRKARIEDSKIILDWRNDKTARLMSINMNEVDEETHQKWLSESLLNPNRTLLIGEYDGIDLGVCRFDYDPNLAVTEVSVNVAPFFRGQGLGASLLNLAVQYYLEQNNVPLVAKIKNENKASVIIFEKCGFKLKHSIGSVDYYTLCNYKL